MEPAEHNNLCPTSGNIVPLIWQYFHFLSDIRPFLAELGYIELESNNLMSLTFEVICMFEDQEADEHRLLLSLPAGISSSKMLKSGDKLNLAQLCSLDAAMSKSLTKSERDRVYQSFTDPRVAAPFSHSCDSQDEGVKQKHHDELMHLFFSKLLKKNSV